MGMFLLVPGPVFSKGILGLIASKGHRKDHHHFGPLKTHTHTPREIHIYSRLFPVSCANSHSLEERSSSENRLGAGKVLAVLTGRMVEGRRERGISILKRVGCEFSGFHLFFPLLVLVL